MYVYIIIFHSRPQSAITRRFRHRFVMLIPPAIRVRAYFITRTPTTTWRFRHRFVMLISPAIRVRAYFKITPAARIKYDGLGVGANACPCVVDEGWLIAEPPNPI